MRTEVRSKRCHDGRCAASYNWFLDLDSLDSGWDALTCYLAFHRVTIVLKSKMNKSSSENHQDINYANGK